jgi:hypothetical protein
MIRQHPRVWLPIVKELHFFDYLYVKDDRKLAEANVKGGVHRTIIHHIRKNNRRKGASVDYEYIKYLIEMATRDLFTEAWYQRIFERPLARNKITGEVTPAYSTIPLEGVRYVYQFLPQARIIYIIRDPFERSLSQLRMLAKRLPTRPSTDEEWRDLARTAGLWSRSDYARFVPLWQTVFPAEQLLFVPYGDIAREPATLLKQIESFIGLKPYAGYKGLQDKIHESDGITIPPSIRDFMSNGMERQERFLTSTFGADFLARTRGRSANGDAAAAPTAKPARGRIDRAVLGRLRPMLSSTRPARPDSLGLRQ